MGRISLANSKYYRGVAAIDEVVPSEMRSYVNRESRTEVELATARSRQQALSSGRIHTVEQEDRLSHRETGQPHQREVETTSAAEVEAQAARRARARPEQPSRPPRALELRGCTERRSPSCGDF